MAAAPRDRAITWIIAAFAFIAAAVTLYQLTRPGLLLGVTPDVSVYVGGAVRLVHGAVPYRDFVFVQPPGFVLLATPVAALSELIGTRDALAVLRLCTPLLAAACVVMVGQLIRHRGGLATLVACAVMAFFPAELYAIRGPQLEPVLILLCLVGSVLVFSGDRLAGSRRLAFGGVVFGFAVAVKATAVLPVLVLVVLCSAELRRRLLPFCGGVAAGLSVPTLPFIVLAPAAFFRDTVTTQLARIPASGRVSLPVRLADLTGISALGASDVVSIASVIALCGFVLAAFAVSRKRPTIFEQFALAAALAVALAQLAPALYFQQYAAFMAPFLAIVLGICVERFARTRAGRPVLAAAAVPLVALIVAQLSYVASESVPDLARAVDAVVPPGGCALSDSPVYLFTADRFQAAGHGCMTMTDPRGTTLALGDTSAEAVATWRYAFAHADYVVTGTPVSDWELPPDAHLPAYVAENFRLVRSGAVLIYVRYRFTTGAPPQAVLSPTSTARCM